MVAACVRAAIAACLARIVQELPLQQVAEGATPAGVQQGAGDEECNEQGSVCGCGGVAVDGAAPEASEQVEQAQVRDTFSSHLLQVPEGWASGQQ